MRDAPSLGPWLRPFGRQWPLAAAALAGLLGLAVLWWWRPGNGGPDAADGRAAVTDPRLTFPTRYRNVRPDVQYVGDAACADCHQDLAASYRHHPMGRALAPVAKATPLERDEPAACNPFHAPDPFVGPGLHYRVRRQGGRVFHRQWAADADGRVLAEEEAEVHFAVGSGRSARSYLVNRDGYLFESPITWFPQAGRWDLSPSYETRNQHFTRPVTPACLFCHSNHAEHVPGTVNRYRPPVFRGHAIGCERCHGPGELHVRRRAAGAAADGPDDTIVNPARLEHPLREAVCQQCHLHGEQRVVRRGGGTFDYRPGLPLHLFVMDFVKEGAGPAEGKFVNSVEQMFASRCYRASRGPQQLGCLSCHDPHLAPAPEKKAAFFRGRCLQCHTEASCHLTPAARRAQNQEDSCFACHMPRTGSEVAHAAVTDHRLPRRPPPGKAVPPEHPAPGVYPLVPFHRHLPGGADAEASRNLGLATLAMLDHGPTDELARRIAAQALPLLETALRRDSEDAPVWEAKALALWCLGRTKEALAACETALAAAPDGETALHLAGRLALRLNQREAGRAYLERALKVNPWQWQYHHLLGADSFRQGEWDTAARALERSLRLGPFNSTARRKMLAACYRQLGQVDRARNTFDDLLRMSPEERRPELRHWFENRPR